MLPYISKISCWYYLELVRHQRPLLLLRFTWFAWPSIVDAELVARLWWHALRDWGLEQSESQRSQDDFVVQQQECKLRLEGKFCRTLRIIWQNCAKQTRSFGISKSLVQNELLGWLPQMLQVTKTFSNCPNGMTAWEAYLTTFFKHNLIHDTSPSRLSASILILLQTSLSTPLYNDTLIWSRKAPEVQCRKGSTRSIRTRCGQNVQDDLIMKDCGTFLP